jgi:hypothetical protein
MAHHNDGLVGLIVFLVCVIVFYILLRSLIRSWKRRRLKAQQAKSFAQQQLLSEERATSTPERIKISPTDRPGEPPALKEVTKSIFISYRREDNPDITGRIYDRLSAQFGNSAVFKDVDSMPLGVDFRDHIREQIGRCAVVVVVIGKNWNGASAAGERRLNDRRDHFRIEIETALERRIPVIPVLVDGAKMPREEELPPSLAQLVYKHGIPVRPDPDFHNDADKLARGIDPLLK